MEDILPTLIIIGAIYLLVRWLTGSKTNNAADGGIRGVTPAMVETIHSAFPDIPIPNVIYHLSRSRSAQSTSEEILERGFLPAPPPNFAIPASLLPSPPVNASTPSTPASSSAPAKSPSTPKPSSLIDRYNLSSRLAHPASVTPPSAKEKEPARGPLGGALDPSLAPGATTTPDIAPLVSSTSPSPALTGSETGAWEATREKRELGLKERKEKMILEARRRMLEKQAKETAAPPATEA